MDPAHGRYLADHISGARLVELPGSDAQLYGEDPDAVLDVVEEFLTGVPPVVAPDRVLATVLFTDLVDSTGRAAKVGDRAWRRLLDRHDDMIRADVARHRGRLVNTAGDGALSVFDAPGRAVRCALGLVAHTANLGLTIRAGVHTAELELRGDDVGGIAVHIGSRVAALAGPEDVLVSSTVKDLVAGSGIEFVDRGEHQLKGVPGTWRLYRAVS
jgi:class 3 adenylate cyclase